MNSSFGLSVLLKHIEVRYPAATRLSFVVGIYGGAGLFHATDRFVWKTKRIAQRCGVL